MVDESEGGSLDLAEVEAELCRLPDVAAVRIVADGVGRPVEVHVVAHTGKHPKQIVRDVQSIALASFGLELDRRIVSVVQLGADGVVATRDDADRGDHRARSRRRSRTPGLRSLVRVTLAHGDDEAVGFAEGSIAGRPAHRLVALATVDALRQLEPGAECIDVDSAQIVRVGAHDIAVVTVVFVDPPLEQLVSGSAIVRTNADDAIVRAVLDATNRRLSHLAHATRRHVTRHPRPGPMSRPVAVFVSFRLGGTDGVAIEARKWEWALRELGFDVRRVAGELDDGRRPDDTWLAFLAIDPVDGAEAQPDALGAAIDGADLVIVENLCSLPLNLEAAHRRCRGVVRPSGACRLPPPRPAVAAPRLVDVLDLPPHRPDALHVTINEGARRALTERGFDAHTVHNVFDLDAAPGDRAGTRDVVRIRARRPRRAAADARDRAQERRGRLRLAEQLAARFERDGRPVRYWISGPAEDGYEPELDALLAAARRAGHDRARPAAGRRLRGVRPRRVPVDVGGIRQPGDRVDRGPPSARGRALSRPRRDRRRDRPRAPAVDDPDVVAAALRAPDTAVLQRNLARVRPGFDLRNLPDRLRRIFAEVAWQRW